MSEADPVQGTSLAPRPLALPRATRMSHFASHSRSHDSRAQARPSSRRRSPAIEGLETRSLLSMFGAMVALNPAAGGKPIPVAMAPMPPTEGPAAFQPGPPSWSILRIEPHGAWDNQPRLQPASSGGPGYALDMPALVGAMLHEELAGPGIDVHHPPELNHGSYFGTLDGDDHLTLIGLPRAMPGNPTMRVNVDFPPALLDAHPNLAVGLFTTAGEDLGRVILPRLGSGFALMVQARPGPDGTVPGLVLGIMRSDDPADAPTVATSSPPISFSISVDRGNISASGGTDPGGNSRPEIDVGSLGPASWTLAPKLDDASRQGNPTLGDDTEPAIGVGQVVAGSFPLRAGGPSGGVLADRETAPAITPMDGAAIDLTLIELSPEVAMVTFDEFGPIAAYATPSGFPLLAVSRPPIVIGFVDEAGERVEPPPLPIPEGVTGDASDNPETTPARAPLTVGLGVAAGLTFGLFLPDVIAGIAPRAAGKPRPRRGFRNLWRKLR